ncbi:hypothetical protein DYU11_27105 [Fibrisoma montanum]|uniref:Lactonase family protein n=1 Tax=Fibrisoma montanum TaxID=2305895 RepID=A0A418LZI3_9BACT|nr:hypothetical protein [Fibrisoma montanum]RIV18645.1 hypothetical protein DYU11_27105 [Fibrisoma montanum]
MNFLRQFLSVSLWLGNIGMALSQLRSVPGASGANFAFQGRYIVAVSDADMIPSAYIDGKLGPVEGQDALSVIRLDRPVRELKAVEVGVSNSVTGPPSVLDVSPDGRYAVVIETRGQRPIGNTDLKLSDLPPGKVITVVNLTDPDHPAVVQRIVGPEYAQSVGFNADGSLVVVAAQPTNTAQPPLTLYRFAKGKLSEPYTPNLPNWVAGEQLNGAVFHPTRNTLAVLNSTKATLSFVQVADEGGRLSLSAWGSPVQVDRQPFKAVFTPDGRYVLTNAMYFGADISATNSVPSSVLSVRLAADTATRPVHQIVDRVVSGVLSEGLAISPDGRWLATANLEQSSNPLTSPKQGFFASVTLIRLNPQSGLLERVGNYAFDGILPESVAFDNTSRFLAVATFDHFDEKRPGGSIDIWRIAGDANDPKRTELVRTNYSVPVTRGVHTMVMVR